MSRGELKGLYSEVQGLGPGPGPGLGVLYSEVQCRQTPVKYYLPATSFAGGKNYEVETQK